MYRRTFYSACPHIIIQILLRSEKMNDTENFLVHLKSELARRVLRSFLAFFALYAAALVISFLLFNNFDFGKYVVACDGSGVGIINGIGNAVKSVFPLALSMILIYLSAYSPFCSAMSAVSAAYFGLSLGTSAALIGRKMLVGVGTGWRVAAWLSFAAAMVMMLFSAVSMLYSCALTYTFSRGEKRYFRSLAAEYTKCFLVISGGVFVLGCASAVFI